MLGQSLFRFLTPSLASRGAALLLMLGVLLTADQSFAQEVM